MREELALVIVSSVMCPNLQKLRELQQHLLYQQLWEQQSQQYSYHIQQIKQLQEHSSNENNSSSSGRNKMKIENLLN